MSEPGCFTDIPIHPDRPAPPGAYVLRSAREQTWVITDSTRFHGDFLISDTLAEDCRSVLESADYLIRYTEHGTPITCECCGTTVALMPEALAKEDRHTRDWKQGIWETETLRKHTLRRCDWKRANP